MSNYVHKSHNVSNLLYHIVCPAKYRNVVFTPESDEVLKEICLEISKRYEIHFIEIGVSRDHVHFLVQSIPMYSPKKIVQVIKSITAREMFIRLPEIKRLLWGGEFWTKGYFISTVGKNVNEDVIAKYVKEHGLEEKYKVLHKEQLSLF
jgi:putative transposase